MREAEREATAALDAVRSESREAVEAAQAQAVGLEAQATAAVEAAQGEVAAATRTADDARAAVTQLEVARNAAEGTRAKNASMAKECPRGHPRL